MVHQVICVEDHQYSLTTLCDYIGALDYGLVPLPFRQPRRALEHLSRIPLPAGFLVDTGIPYDVAGPDALFKFAQQAGILDRFYFMTSGDPAEDLVVRRTGAQHFMKGDIRSLEAALERMVSTQCHSSAATV